MTVWIHFRIRPWERLERLCNSQGTGEKHYISTYANESVVSITLPDSITMFEESAFSGCVNLTTINITKGTKMIKACKYFIHESEDLNDIQSNMIHFQNAFSPQEFERIYDFKGQVEGME